jgi:glycine/D-amino acid oxidase-like deaminating enzyme
MASMLDEAVRWLPALAECRIVRAWTGWRPATPDSLPLIGEWSPEPGLWIAAGHEGLGITTATGTAAIITAALTGRQPPIDPLPFAPARVQASAGVA